jgi:Tfp pilus assembly protein FimV
VHIPLLQQEPVSHAEHVAPPKNVPPVAMQVAIDVNVQPPDARQQAPLEHAIHVIPTLNTPKQSYLNTFSLQDAPRQQDPVTHASEANIPAKKFPLHMVCLTPSPKLTFPFTQHVPVIQ